MSVDVTSVLVKRLARNRGPVPGDPDHRQPPNYGVEAHYDDGILFVTLTFRAGSAYCCYEWGCHFASPPSRRWDALRTELVKLGLTVPERMHLHAKTIIEDGAIFFDWSRPDRTRRGWFDFAAHDAYQYEHIDVEGEIGSPQADARPSRPASS